MGSHPSCHTEPMPHGPQDEAALVAEAIEGSEPAFRTLVERYQRPVFSLVLRMVRDRGIAEDVTQEVFVKAWLALARYDPRRRFASWLFKIASNAAIDQLRRKKLPTTSIETSDPDQSSILDRIEDERSESPDTLVKRRELSSALEAAVAALRPEYRLVVLLRFREELPYRDIAEATGMPLGTVKTNLRRARREIEERLRKDGVV
ncbi:MAG: sigma-70 family RNA polymerase sigma factor [Holophagales bacterium]|nr:sigma-70 family RNA polymerase sigma factor [Holophagales bacterium]MYH24035.1 sigma-70 family RNA polymerase sigma factor [Holophagales bacterium]